MKVWHSFGSEHSAKLVMIGRFKDATSAEKTKAAIDEIATFVTSSGEEFRGADLFSDRTMDVLKKVGVYSITPGELEHFAYDFDVELKGRQVTLSTEELEVTAFLKIMIDNGARIEVYSAHDYPDI